MMSKSGAILNLAFRFLIIRPMKNFKSLAEKAIDLCDYTKKTLIFTKKQNYVPSLRTLCSLRTRVFMTEDEDAFTTVTANFDLFDAFIFVNRTLNNFEKEFFSQLRAKSNKSIIELC